MWKQRRFRDRIPAMEHNNPQRLASLRRVPRKVRLELIRKLVPACPATELPLAALRSSERWRFAQTVEMQKVAHVL
jgi:hypothetical protein